MVHGCKGDNIKGLNQNHYTSYKNLNKIIESKPHLYLPQWYLSQFGITTGLLLSYLVNFYKLLVREVIINSEDNFYRSQENITKDICIKRFETERSIKELEDLEILKSIESKHKRKENIKHFHINLEKLHKLEQDNYNNIYYRLNKQLLRSLGYIDSIVITSLYNQFRAEVKGGYLDNYAIISRPAKTFLKFDGIKRIKLEKSLKNLEDKKIIQIRKMEYPLKNFYYINFTNLEKYFIGKSRKNK